MAAKPGPKKKSGGTRGSVGAGDKDRLIDELKNRIAILENELRLKQEDVSPSDVCERKWAEDWLWESEEKYRRLVNEISDWICEVDENFVCTYTSPRIMDVLGYEPEDVVGKSAFDFMPPGEKDRLFKAIDTGIASKDGFDYIESVLIRKDGSNIIVEIKGKPIVDRRGRFQGYQGVIRDITERKRAEEALRESEEKFRLMADFTKDWESWMSPRREYVYVSPSCEQMTGHSADEFYRDPGLLIKLIHPDDRAAYEGHRSDYVKSMYFIGSIDFRIVLANGETRWLNHLCQPVFGRNGEWLGRWASNRDITDRKMAEIALLESEERYHSIIKQSSSGFLLIDNCGTIIDFNPAGEESTGLYAADWLGKYVWDFNVELMPTGGRTQAMREQMKAEIMDLFRTGSSPWINNPCDIMLQRPDGKRRIVQIMVFPIRTSNGMNFGAFICDVTDRRQAEETLRLAQFTLEISSDMVVWLDSEARIIYVNDAAIKALGYTREEILSMRVPDVDPSFSLESWPVFWREVREKGHLLIESTHRSRDGRIYPVEITVNFIRSGDKEFISSSGKDITERKQAEAALLDSKEQAELYLDLMGHDINNMHQIVLGYLELAEGMAMGDSQRDMLRTSIEVLQRSARLIQNVRKLQRHRDGLFQTCRVDVAGVVSTVQREFGDVPDKPVVLNLNGREHYYVRANELLHDVFANLVSNSIRHTNTPAQIVIDVDRVAEDGRACCRVIVEDDGPGIPDEKKGHIFNRMHKGSTRGMGLGLYLVKSLVDSYGGRVWVEDRVVGDHAKDARFVVMLPTVKSQP